MCSEFWQQKTENTLWTEMDLTIHKQEPLFCLGTHLSVVHSYKNTNHSNYTSVHALYRCTVKWNKGVVQSFAWNFQTGWIFLAVIPAIITTFDSHRWSPGCFQPGPFVRQIVNLFCCSVTITKVPGFLLRVNKKGGPSRYWLYNTGMEFCYHRGTSVLRLIAS